MYRLTILLLSFFLVTACSSIIGKAPVQQSADAQKLNEQLRSEADALAAAVKNQRARLMALRKSDLWVRITFDSGRAGVKEDTHLTLHALVEKYRTLQGLESDSVVGRRRHYFFVVQGFCDNEPIGGYDGSHIPPAHHYKSLLALSEARAVTVAEMLMQSGIPHEDLLIQPFGATHFVARNDSDSEREKNRRVDVFLVHQ